MPNADRGRDAYYYAPPAQSRYVWLVSRAEEWSWSSVRAHLAGEDDSLVSVRPVLDRWPNFRELLLQDYDDALTSLRKAEGIGPFSGTESAGINRHIVGDERALRKRRSDSILASSLACELARDHSEA